MQIAVCVPGKVRREQGLDLEPVRVDLQAAVQPAVYVATFTLFMSTRRLMHQFMFPELK